MDAVGAYFFLLVIVMVVWLPFALFFEWLEGRRPKEPCPPWNAVRGDGSLCRHDHPTAEAALRCQRDTEPGAHSTRR